MRRAAAYLTPTCQSPQRPSHYRRKYMPSQRPGTRRMSWQMRIAFTNRSHKQSCAATVCFCAPRLPCCFKSERSRAPLPPPRARKRHGDETLKFGQ
eukprot:2190853-Pleurochrysis_carterae.AAC.1